MTYLEIEELDYFHLTDCKGSPPALTGSDILTGNAVSNALDEHLAKINLDSSVDRLPVLIND